MNKVKHNTAYIGDFIRRCRTDQGWKNTPTYDTISFEVVTTMIMVQDVTDSDRNDENEAVDLQCISTLDTAAAIMAPAAKQVLSTQRKQCIFMRCCTIIFTLLVSLDLMMFFAPQLPLRPLISLYNIVTPPTGLGMQCHQVWCQQIAHLRPHPRRARRQSNSTRLSCHAILAQVRRASSSSLSWHRIKCLDLAVSSSYFVQLSHLNAV